MLGCARTVSGTGARAASVGGAGAIALPAPVEFERLEMTAAARTTAITMHAITPTGEPSLSWGFRAQAVLRAQREEEALEPEGGWRGRGRRRG